MLYLLKNEVFMSEIYQLSDLMTIFNRKNLKLKFEILMNAIDILKETPSLTKSEAICISMGYISQDNTLWRKIKHEQ